MVSALQKLLFPILLLLILLIIVYLFLPQIQELLSRNMEQVEANEEPEETEPEETFLNIESDDEPEEVLYKLFSEFDIDYLNEKSGLYTLYNPFILDLQGNTYNTVNSVLIDNIVEGINDFNSKNTKYSIINPSNCANVLTSSAISYANGCWSNTLSSNSCNIYVNSFPSTFSGRIKIRVRWFGVGNVIRAIVTMCDG